MAWIPAAFSPYIHEIPQNFAEEFPEEGDTDVEISCNLLQDTNLTFVKNSKAFATLQPKQEIPEGSLGGCSAGSVNYTAGR